MEKPVVYIPRLLSPSLQLHVFISIKNQRTQNGLQGLIRMSATDEEIWLSSVAIMNPWDNERNFLAHRLTHSDSLVSLKHEANN